MVSLAVQFTGAAFAYASSMLAAALAAAVMRLLQYLL
jgi:hypothetical protein